ncbi:histidine kinase [Paenibacillus sp. D2_2]|uniref:histidine kinase n=1 Tax=Paenibacillus sp. D2_2 TaxID=3073092 RepID=UPI0028149BF8|nr:histidine kinase [Paenibacillus sp. D2_2]WMT38934.1 histidine kinase [Paenibacillus sp. D2_2]
MTYRRKTPEEILQYIERMRRGKLKVLIGATSGAGKTYHMLREGQLLRSQGIDVIACAVSTSQRQETVEQLVGIERLPSLHWMKEGSEKKDLPLEQILQRNPEVVLVDNLAHRNREEARFATRLEDILFLLEQGISVITTINVYELSGADLIAQQYTGIQAEDTVPPETLDLADEVRFIDVSPETLLKRIEEGVLGQKVNPAICRRDNVAVLRELSLRLMADGVSDMLDKHRMSEGLVGPSGTAERILVSVQYHWNGSIYIRRGQQIAKRLNGEVIVTVFMKPGTKLSQEQRAFKSSIQQLCSKIGAEFLELPLLGRRRLAGQLAEFALERNITRIVMGHSRMSAWQDIRRGSVIKGLLRKLQNTDLFLMADRAETEGERIMAMRSFKSDYHANTTFRRSSLEEADQRKKHLQKGSLKVYIGAAPGVGKTYTMLREGNQLRAKGIDIVIGLLETHGRRETQEQIGKLELIPRMKLQYRQTKLEEMDTGAILQRNPEVVLIDELAHTNVPGSRFKKRYEDILLILEAGVSVITTVNVQHLESLNDSVESLTGIRVRERVPDAILQMADEVELIDVTPQMLQLRLREGKIYAQSKVEQSLNSFFKMGNLIALRELALRELADDVDERLESWERRTSLRGPWRKKEIIFVCIDHNSGAERIIRRGFRLAYRLKAEWHVAYVGHHNMRDDSPELERISNLTQQLGGKFELLHMKRRKETAAVLLARAEELGASQIIIGQTVPKGLCLLTGEALSMHLLRGSTMRDVLIVSRQKS